MTEKIFFDTSAIFSFINAKDPDHKKVKDFVSCSKVKMTITNYIFDEAITLTLSRLGYNIAVKVGDTLMNSPQIERVWVNQNDEKEAWNLFRSRQDKEYSFTDCVSFIVMRRLRIRKYLAFDDHFKQEGFEKV